MGEPCRQCYPVGPLPEEYRVTVMPSIFQPMRTLMAYWTILRFMQWVDWTTVNRVLCSE